MITKQEVDALKAALHTANRNDYDYVMSCAFYFMWGVFSAAIRCPNPPVEAQWFFDRIKLKLAECGITPSTPPAADHASCPPPA